MWLTLRFMFPIDQRPYRYFSFSAACARRLSDSGGSVNTLTWGSWLR